MDPVATSLGELLQRPVIKVDEVAGDTASQAAADLQPGQVLLLENTRFEAGEKKNDLDLASELAAMADVYVDDAFGSAHRAHASTEGVAQAMRAKGGAAVAGFLMGKELEALGTAVSNPPHPYVAIMGGAKISDKIKLIENLLQKADKILIGGGMANTFLAALGYNMGKSLVEEEAIAEAKSLLEADAERLILPVDVIVAEAFAADAPSEAVRVDRITANQMALDIGPATLQLFESELEGAALVIWNGPMGVFEFEKFATGTNQLALTLADLVDQGAQVVIGGGDSAAAVRKANLTGKMTHVSTGGGASLELLEGKELPGIAALDDR